MKTKIYLPEIIGKGYGSFWNFKGRYRVVKGSRASKKSTTAALNMIYNIMKYPESNGLVVRKVYRTIKDSSFAQLKWAINRLNVEKYWKATTNPLELTYTPTGQKILFRGLDDPLKITSVTVDRGYLTFVWIEEAYEITKEEDFDMLDESIRGEVPGNLYKQITLTLNPWNERHWIKSRFFDTKDPNIFAATTNYQINEWLDETDYKIFERMKAHNPRRYKVAGLGDWGIVDGLVFENWKEQAFKISEATGEEVYGLDFGFTNDPSALFCGKIDIEEKKIFVFDEIYERGLTNEVIADKLYNYGLEYTRVTADNSEPKSIARIKTLGIKKITRSRKGKDSIQAGIDFIQDFEIIVHPRCVNFITEISNYTWEIDKTGNKLNKPVDYDNHLMDAMRYALERYTRARPKNL